MQRDLDALMDWGSTWGMKFNTKKCNIMRVSRSRKPLQHFYSLGNEILQEVSDAKYLGIQIDNKLDWNNSLLIVPNLLDYPAVLAQIAILLVVCLKALCLVHCYS